jgi:hypothetical protein
MRKLSLVIAILLFCTSSIDAQESTGSVIGAIRDATGAAIPGADIKLHNLALGVSLHFRTGDKGDYLAPALVPGVYTVTASAEGFSSAQLDRIEILVGKQYKQDFTLTIQPVLKTVTVTEEEPSPVDVTSNKAATNLSRELIESIPKPRSFQNLAVLAMGAQVEIKGAFPLGTIQVHGASQAENTWFIDGVDTTSILSGLYAKDLPVDWLEELQVKSGGMDAEYGGALGGVIHAITRSGTNNLHGDVRYYYYGTKLKTAPRPRFSTLLATSAQYVHDPKDDQNVNDFGFQLGGPAVKNRLWYFLAYQPVLDQTSRTVYFPTYNLTRTYENQATTHYWTSKVTFQPWERVRTNISVTSNSQTGRGILPNYDGYDNPNAGFETIGLRSPNVTYAVDTSLRATNTLLFNFRLGYFFSDSHPLTLNREVKFVFAGNPTAYSDQLAPEFRQSTGWSNIVSNFGLDHNTFTRLSGNADGSWFTRFHGVHNLKFGYQVYRLRNDILSSFLNDALVFYFDQTYTNQTKPGVSRGAYGYYSNQFLGSKGIVTGYNHGIYMQDAWQLNHRLTLNLGLRTEQETVPSYRSDKGIQSTAIRFPFSEKLAPRLGFAYDVRGDGKGKVYGSFGLYYDVMKYTLPFRTFGGQVNFYSYYTLDTLDIAKIGNGNYPGTKIETIDFSSNPANAIHPEVGGSSLLDPNLKPMRTREYTAGYERAIGRAWVMNVRYTRERLDRAIEDVGAQLPNTVYFDANPGEGITRKFYGPGCDQVLGGADCASYPATPKPTRRYDGVELRAESRLIKNWQNVFSYTLSRLSGNYSGLSTTDANQVTPNYTTYYDSPLAYVDAKGRYIDGPLATDRTHTFKDYGSYRIPLGRHSLNVGAVFTAGSGTPMTRGVSVAGTTVLVENRNSDGRRGAFSLTNLYIADDFKLTEHGTLRLDFNLDNAFNQSTALSYAVNYTRNGIAVGIPGSSIQTYSDATKGFDYLKQIELQANNNRPASCGSFAADPYCLSAPMRLDPTFMKANVFQVPLAGRFGVRFIF